MIEFITQDTNLCPYCKSELTLIYSMKTEVWTNARKRCEICKKDFEIAEFKKAQPGDVITLDDDIQWKKNATCEINAQVQKE